MRRSLFSPIGLCGFALVLLVPSLLEAATVRGRVTQCGDGGTRYDVVVLERLEVGISVDDLPDLPGPRPLRKAKPCQIGVQTRELGRTTTDSDGNYSISVTPATPFPGTCRFLSEGFVRVLERGSGTILWTSPRGPFSSTMTINRDLPCRNGRVQGRITECGLTASGHEVVVFASATIGNPIGGGGCIAVDSEIFLGRASVGANGSYSLNVTEPSRPTKSCAFILHGIFVEARVKSTGEVRWRSSTKPLAATMSFSHDFPCETATVAGRILECGAPFVGQEIRVLALKRIGFELPDDFDPLKPCTTTTQTEVLGSVLTGAAGTYSLSFEKPTAPPLTCRFQVDVRIQVRDPQSGDLRWLSPTKPLGETTFIDGNLCEGDVWRVSVKFILDANGNRAASGALNTVTEVHDQIAIGNSSLCATGRDVTLELVEIVELEGVSQWFMAGCDAKDDLESAAENDPELYAWRSNAINVYIVGGNCAGICSFPHEDDIILIGQNTRDTTIIHEIGHFFDLCHTQGCPCGSCDPDQSGTCHTMPGDDGIDDTLPDLSCWDRDQMSLAAFGNEFDDLSLSQRAQVNDTFRNVMSYHSDQFVFTDEQMDVMMETASDVRSHVVGQRTFPLPCSIAAPAPRPVFRRGDSNVDGDVDIADPVKTLFHLTRGASIACEDAADSNDDGQLDLADAVYTLRFLFLATAAPEAPSAYTCGIDPTDDGMERCEYGARCPEPSL